MTKNKNVVKTPPKQGTTKCKPRGRVVGRSSQVNIPGWSSAYDVRMQRRAQQQGGRDRVRTRSKVSHMGARMMDTK